jgi:cytochrome c556
LTEADFAAAMEEMDYVSGDAELHIDAKYWGDLGTDTDAMKALLEQVRTFWVAREVQGAIDFTEQALAATAALSRASGTGDGGQADQAFSDLRATCRSCHREFRERTEDGGYRIKPGG